MADKRDDPRLSASTGRNPTTPNLDFVDRMAGTLPETVTVGDLEALNSALQWLFTESDIFFS